jgi:preprotein translocase subunit SecG
MLAVIIGLTILAALLLVLVVLAQNSKGGGLSSQFGGAGASQVMGVKKTGDILEKATWGLAIAIMVLSLSTNFFLDTAARDSGVNSPNINRAQEKTIIPGMPTDGAAEEEALPLNLDTDTTQQ